jgi:hypothetical protein
MKSAGIAVWLNSLQFEKLKDLERGLQDALGRELTHGEAVMVSALMAKVFISFISLGTYLIEKGELDPDLILNTEYIQKTVKPESSSVMEEISKVGRQIEKVFIQLDTLGLLKKTGGETKITNSSYV